MNGLLQQEFEHGTNTKEFLRAIWYPTIGNFNFLHAKWEVRDFGNRCRYLDLAYMPGGAKNKPILYWMVGCSYR